MKHQSPATLTALLFLSLLLVTESPRYLQDKSTSTLQQQIATQVLRFHIRANSDTVADQQKKSPDQTIPPGMADTHPIRKHQ